MSPVQQPHQIRSRPRVGGLMSTVLEIGISFAGYYLLRACGVGVFWALTVPGIAVAVVALVTTVRRKHIDMIGFLVLCEVCATIVLSLVTQDARIAAIREPVYVLIGGVFGLSTLFYRTPFSHQSAASMATFGDPKREAAFRYAWREVPRYRMWQRLLTASFGIIAVGTSIVRFDILYTSPHIPDAVDTSNVISIVMFVGLAVVGVVLIQPARRIIMELSAKM